MPFNDVRAALVPKAFGSWGLSDGVLGQSLGRPDGRKAAARKLLAGAGYGPASPLRFEAQTRGIATDVDLASYVVSELRRVGVEIALKQLDSVQWYGVTTRKEVSRLIEQQSRELDLRKRVAPHHSLYGFGRMQNVWLDREGALLNRVGRRRKRRCAAHALPARIAVPRAVRRP